MSARIACIVGTRPELIKMAPVIRALRAARQALETTATASAFGAAPGPAVTVRGVPLPAAWLPFVVEDERRQHAG